MGKTKQIDLYAELKEGLEEMVAIEKGQKKPVDPSNVGQEIRWAHDGDTSELLQFEQVGIA